MRFFFVFAGWLSACIWDVAVNHGQMMTRIGGAVVHLARTIGIG